MEINESVNRVLKIAYTFSIHVLTGTGPDMKNEKGVAIVQTPCNETDT